MPTDQVAAQWVDDLYPLIKKIDSGVEKNLKEKRCYEDAPYTGYKAAGKAIIGELQVDHSADHKEGGSGKYQGAGRSEGFSIFHHSIFSRDTEMRAA